MKDELLNNIDFLNFFNINKIQIVSEGTLDVKLKLSYNDGKIEYIAGSNNLLDYLDNMQKIFLENDPFIKMKNDIASKENKHFK